MLNQFIRDAEFGVRLLRRNPGFAAVAILSLGLGIGGATAVFSLVNAIVLRRLPVPDPAALVQARSVAQGREFGDLFSALMYEHARDELVSRGAGELFAATSVAGMQLQADGEAIGARGNVQLVSGEYFTALRQQPQLGRLLAPSDNTRVGAHPVAVVSDGYWRRRLNAAPDVVGRSLAINGTSFSIVGVTGPSFFGTTLSLRAPDAWIPFMMQPVVRYAQNASNTDAADPRKPWPPQPQMSWLNVFGRVSKERRGVMEAGFTTILQREREGELSKDASAEDRAGVRQQRVELIDASTGLSSLRRAVQQPLYVLLAMVGVLLAIACGNVAGLLLSRSAGRAREMAIRQSIGAGRLRLVRQMIAESLVLAIAGGFVGITFAIWGREGLLRLMVNVGSSAAPVDLDTGLDWRVLAFAIGVSALTGIACGVIPAVRGTRVSVAEALKQDGRGSVTEGGRRGLLVGKTLVAVQMAFCLLLLVVAALFMRSFRSLVQTDIGFDRDHVLTSRLDVRGAGYSAPERQELYRRLSEALRALPGVEAVSFSLTGPLGGSQRISSLSVEDYTPAPKEQLRTNEEYVTQSYFETMGLKILEGRGFTAEDRAPGTRNTIINATMARRFFAGKSAIGRRWDYGDAVGKDSNMIVGVVEDARYAEVKATPPNMAYSLSDASPDEVLSELQLRTAGDPARLTQVVRETLARAEPRLPIVEVVPLTDRLARDVIQDRMVASLTAMFGALALLLASLGLYGTISYGISRRVAELGLRMALGADRGDVLWMVLREALLLVAAGVIAGIPLAVLAGRAISALLVGVAPGDPLAFSTGAVLLLVVAAVAAYLPAYRASRIEPMTALSR
jgi:putative ABC transport system permease protein